MAGVTDEARIRDALRRLIAAIEVIADHAVLPDAVTEALVEHTDAARAEVDAIRVRGDRVRAAKVPPYEEGTR